jgi:hypothetical protein
MTDPVDGFDRALAAAFAPPDGERAGLRVRPGAGARLRAAAVRRRTGQVTIRLTTAAAVLALLLAGGSVLRGAPASGPGGQAIQRAGGMPMTASGPAAATPFGLTYGPTRLARPLEVYRVAASGATLCPSAPPHPVVYARAGVGRTCYLLDRPGALAFTRVDGIRVQWLTAVAAEVRISLPPTETTALARYTLSNLGSRVAFVVGQQVWYAVQLTAPIEHGQIEILGGFSAGDADALVGSLGLQVLSVAAGTSPPG